MLCLPWYENCSWSEGGSHQPHISGSRCLPPLLGVQTRPGGWPFHWGLCRGEVWNWRISSYGRLQKGQTDKATKQMVIMSHWELLGLKSRGFSRVRRAFESSSRARLAVIMPWGTQQSPIQASMFQLRVFLKAISAISKLYYSNLSQILKQSE